jgi:hypothetical protein
VLPAVIPAVCVSTFTALGTAATATTDSRCLHWLAACIDLIRCSCCRTTCIFAAFFACTAAPTFVPETPPSGQEPASDNDDVDDDDDEDD